jgi:hypothetical protein
MNRFSFTPGARRRLFRVALVGSIAAWVFGTLALIGLVWWGGVPPQGRRAFYRCFLMLSLIIGVTPLLYYPWGLQRNAAHPQAPRPARLQALRSVGLIVGLIVAVASILPVLVVLLSLAAGALMVETVAGAVVLFLLDVLIGALLVYGKRSAP